MDKLNKEIKDANKNCFSLFKELLHESICKDWDQIVRNQCYSTARYVELGGVRVPAVK